MRLCGVLIGAVLLWTVRVNGQCGDTVGCFPSIGNIALYRNITATSTCGENGITQFAPLFVGGGSGSGAIMECLATDPQLAYPASNINDGDLTTSWQSEIGVDNVTVQLDLEGPMLFESLRIVWSTPRPAAMLIERSADNGNSWIPYRYYATDCRTSFMLNNTSVTPDTIFDSTDAVCTMMVSQAFPFTDSEVTFNTSSHFFPGITDSEKLDYQTITNLRLSLLQTNTMAMNNELEQYYGISEWFVYGTCSCNGHADQCAPVPGEIGPPNKVFAGCDCQHRTTGNNCEVCQPLFNNAEYSQGTATNVSICQMCQCFGHADECVYNSIINGGECVCGNNTEGVMCDSCTAGFYRDPAVLLTDACIDCGCFLPGLSDPMICNNSTGVCLCKSNVDSVVNTICDTCIDGYWNISDSNPDGCQECQCSSTGSISQTCDKTFGNCTCSDNHLPPFCTDCMDGSFLSSGDCVACICTPIGAVNDSCTQADGQCYCRENITNIRCNAPANGFYARPLDFFLFEAEVASYPSAAAREVFPAVNNPTNFTGQGYLEVITSTTITFQFSVSISYQYDLVIRYSAMSGSILVSPVIQSLSSVNTTLQCLNITGVTREETIFASLDSTITGDMMLTHGAENIHSMCLETGVMYEARFSFFLGPFSPMTFLLDSIVLIPSFATESAYLNSPEVIPRHVETLDDCIPTVLGQVNLVCDPDLVFILSLEFFGQVYSCGCNSVGTAETLDCSPSSGVCSCKEGIGGTLCDRCIPSYFNFSVDGCTACNCFSPGVVDFTYCDPVNGTCVCKANVDNEVNQFCDMCRDGYWNISIDNPEGCQECQCDPIGSANSICDKVLGNCPCIANFTGQTCSECADGYYLYNNQCVPCACNPVGSSDNICNQTNGQCNCMSNIEGRTCNVTQTGFFYRALDSIRFEAENVSYSEEFTEVFPITTNLVFENTFTGRGYIAYPSTATEERLRFILTVPRSFRYEMILRYRVRGDIIVFAIIQIRSLTPTVNSLACIVSNDTTAAIQTVILAPDDVFNSFDMVCLDEGTEYEVIVSYLSPQPDISFEIDSIVLMPLFETESNFFTSSNIQRDQLNACIPRAAGSVPPDDDACDQEIAFSLSTEFFEQVYACDCDPTGTRAPANSCESSGGFCSCKGGVGGERCDQCLNGHYLFSTNGCTACGCDVSNSISLLCDDGQCSCVPGISGPQCNECEDGRYNFTSSGCQLCNCESLGSASNNCNKSDGTCPCIGGAIGELCDACPVGTILTSTSYQNFCEPCRCYTRSDTCTVDTNTYNLAIITSDFIQLCNNSLDIVEDGWTLEGNGTFTMCGANGLGYNSSIADMDRFVAPSNFIGDLTGSYSLQLLVQLQLSQNASIQSNRSTVELCGPGGIECLVGEFEVDSSYLQSQRVILLSISFRETYWQYRSDPASQPTYLEFLYTLSDVTSLTFSASYAEVDSYYLQRISLLTVVLATPTISDDLVIIESMFPVEECQGCSANYTGQFCEGCAAGFYRPAGGLDCILCNCNSLSQSCDPLTGACIECDNNSTGDSCELCIPGTYGEPAMNITCQPCQCGVDNINPICILDVDGNQTCITCPMGYTGRNCDVCADNYTLSPRGNCFQCECFDNAVPPDGGPICDMENGLCNSCSFNTVGTQCEQCLPGFFGDPTGEAKCSECTCHVNGTEGLCDSVQGVCTCKPGTTGRDCDQCLPGFWGLHLGSCRPCGCCNNGSIDGSCDQITGRCFCLPGVGGDNDEQCCQCSEGSYNFLSGVGCQDCGCSVAVVTPQCNENGTCACTDGAVGETCSACGFQYSGEIPDCVRCPVCFDTGLEYINELAANITVITLQLDQLIATQSPLTNISDTISTLDYQLAQVESTIRNMLVTQSNVTYLQREANDTKILLAVLQQNFTFVSSFLDSVNASVTQDLEVIAMFEGTVDGVGVADIRTRLQTISTRVSNLNISSYNFLQSLQQQLMAAYSVQNDFDDARINITDSLLNMNETVQLLQLAENLINSTTVQNTNNRMSLSLLTANITALQNELQIQLNRAQSYEAQLNSTFLRAITLRDARVQTEQELQDSSVLIEQLYNYSNISIDLTMDAMGAFQDLNGNVSLLMSRTEELFDNITIQFGVIVNITRIISMVNSTTWDTLALSTPSIESVEMLVREINNTFMPATEADVIVDAISNGTAVAQQTLELARNASVLVGQIMLLVNDTMERINSSELLYDHVNMTLQQLLDEQNIIESYALQVTNNLASLNNSVSAVNGLMQVIDSTIANAYTIGISNYNRSTALRSNASELCAMASNLEQQSVKLNMSLVNVSNEISMAEQDATSQLATVQMLRDEATALNTTAHRIALQELQDLLDEYLADRTRINALTTNANSVSNELDQLIADIEETSIRLEDCIRTP